MTRSSPQSRILGAFLRARREALAPSDVGLHPMPGRRRARGLRREEAAQICGISTTWYTWLEQGRDVACSAATLGRIASALHLSAAERRYVFDLAAMKDPQPMLPAHQTLPADVSAFPDLVDAPCYVLDTLWNARAANVSARHLFAEWLGGEEKNLLRYVFLSPQARNFLDDWEASARRVLAEFRADSLRGDPVAVEELVTQLRGQSADFERLWHAQSVLMREGGARRFHHPQDGVLDFEQITLGFSTWPEYRLVTLRPLRGLL